MEKMFCFQCEQTAGCTGCTTIGVCGKTADIAKIQDNLIGALINKALLLSENSPTKEEANLFIDGLFSTLTNVNFNAETLNTLIKRTNVETFFDMDSIWNANEDIRSLKSLILFGLKGIAAYEHHAYNLGATDKAAEDFIVKALQSIATKNTMEELLPVVLEVGKINLGAMEALNNANKNTYGIPTPTEVSLSVEKGPFIVITGHDLHDLKLLLEQSEGKGVNIYTHGEMLAAHAYAELKKYPHLKGHFGSAWQNQQKEFANLPAPILFTTNCLMPTRDTYKDNVYTTAVVSYPNTKYIDKNKDFNQLINHAITLGGFSETQEFNGANGGKAVTTGFSNEAILSHAETVVNGVKNGDISHFFLVAGCDGIKPSRSYYKDFVALTPKDSIVLTLACGKFRFNDLALGEVAGLPRLMDIGQCNDAYGAIQVAVALAQAFDCDVNDLPLSIVLSWYEQKAVAILLTLLYLGIKNIYLGPTLPAFVSPNVLNFLVENYNIHPTTTAQDDLNAILSK